jgi:hypothetical protein
MDKTPPSPRPSSSAGWATLLVRGGAASAFGKAAVGCLVARLPFGGVRSSTCAAVQERAQRNPDRSHLAEEQPDGTLRFLDAREFGPQYPYLQWLAVRMGVVSLGEAS